MKKSKFFFKTNLKIYFVLFILFFIYPIVLRSQTLPGGVSGLEVWLKANWTENNQSNYVNHALNASAIVKKCSNLDNSLYNFNQSFFSENFCMNYLSNLENSNGRDFFIVNESKNPNSNFYSLLSSVWRNEFTAPTIQFTDSINRNFFDLNEAKAFSYNLNSNYLSYNDQHINYFQLKNYQIDKKFKSYGIEGESLVYIGANNTEFNNSENNSIILKGNIPEFLSYNKELTYNEKNRVFSYLALKYGITLNSNDSYINSRNKIFWDKSNNIKFNNRIFGIGKDVISGLNQLQSESSHNKYFLISAVGEIVQTNFEKQENTFIDDNNFLVFGDNGLEFKLNNLNNYGVKFWDLIWLAQRTGEFVHNYPIHFKLILDNEIIDYITEYPDNSIWLLQDNYVYNNEYSDFNSNQVKYYESAINLEQGYAYFKDVFFDEDKNIYDQFTFGVGPKMIVQVQPHGCNHEKFYVTINITGGSHPYKINVESENESFNVETFENTYDYFPEIGMNYNVTVTDGGGFPVSTDFVAQPWNFNLDLGEDLFLDNNTTEITLDASVGITDAEATYQWFWDDNLLTNTLSSLIVIQPGIYKVKVTSKDRSCIVEDEIKITYKGFNYSINVIDGCDVEHNSMLFNINGGIPPYTVTLNSSENTVNYTINGSESIQNIPYGNYTFIIEDNLGYQVVGEATINPPLNIDFGIDLYSQLENICSDCVDDDNIPITFHNYLHLSFDLDASFGVTNQNIVYEWFMDDISTGVFQPVISLENGSSCSGNGRIAKYTVLATDISTNCQQSQSFFGVYLCINQSPPNIEYNTTNNLPVGLPQNIILNSSEDIIYNELKTVIYPNPTIPLESFTYEIFSDSSFEAKLEIISMTGQIIYSKDIEVNNHFSTLLKLDVAGTYIVKVSNSEGINRTNKIIVK